MEVTTMGNNKLWDEYKEWQSDDYNWVDLTHELSPETPHWYGFSPLKRELLFDYSEDAPEEKKAPMRCIQYTVASQYGTHVDAPVHFIPGGRSLGELKVEEFVYPLVVIDKHKECEEKPEFTLSIDDIKEWEKEYGRIPERAFVAFRSDWYKKEDLENKDADGQPHYPGWAKETIEWLVKERNIGSIGHEPADTDPSYITTAEGAYPYPAEQYILSADRFQIEVMRNLDQVPATGSLIFVGVPKMKDGVGYPARAYALVPAK